MKYLLTILGVVLLIPCIVWIIGMTLPQSHTAEISRQFEATPEEIFTLITDVEHFPNWRTNVDRVEIINDDEKSFQWREYYTNEDPLSFRIVESHENSMLVTEIADENLPFGGSWTYKIQPEGKQTQLTIIENGDVYNPIFRFISKFVLEHEGTIKQYMTDLETAVNE